MNTILYKLNLSELINRFFTCFYKKIIKHFDLKPGTTLYKDASQNFFLLDDSSSLLIAKLEFSSIYNTLIINCKSLIETKPNFYLEIDDLEIVEKFAIELKPVLLLC